VANVNRIIFSAFILSLCVYSPSTIALESKQDTSSVIQILGEAQDLIYKGEGTVALEKINRAKFLSDSLKFEFGSALSEVRLADILISRQKYDSAITVLNNTITKYPNSRARPYFYNQLAAVYNFIAQPRKSIETYEKALDYIYLLDENQQSRTVAGIRVNMASAYKKIQDRENIFKNYLEGLKFAEASKDTIFLVITLNNLGDTYNNYQEYEKADFRLRKALDLALMKDFKGELLRIYLNLGNTQTNLKNYDEALDFYNKALELNDIVRPGSPPFQILYNLGNLYLKNRDFDNAKSFFEESLKYCEELNIPQGLYYNYTGLANLYSEFSDPDTSVYWYKKALEVAVSLNMSEFILELHEKLYDVYKSKESPKDALFHLESARAIADSLNDVLSKSALADLESTLELDRQTEINRLLEEKQGVQERQLLFKSRFNIAALVAIVMILLLLYFVLKTERERKKVNQLLQNQKRELEDLNQTKDKLFAIVAHDLRSPIASIQGILYMINNSDLTLEEIKELSTALEPKLQKNIDTLDDLLLWARQQMSGIQLDLKIVDTKPIIDNMIGNQLFQLEAKEITVENNIPEYTTSFVDISAFTLIIRNLLSNSTKFTDPNGKIEFKCSEEEEFITYSIKDTGIGIPKNIQDSVFEDNSKTRRGTNMEIGSGFGLSLCKEFVLRMNGEIYFETEENIGTTFFVKLPKKSPTV